jgi:hypothetical protein
MRESKKKKERNGRMLTRLYHVHTHCTTTWKYKKKIRKKTALTNVRESLGSFGEFQRLHEQEKATSSIPYMRTGMKEKSATEPISKILNGLSPLW